MTTHTDRIRQMAQEATAYADAMDGSGQMAGRIWSDVRDEYFAQLVAEDCANVVDRQYATEHNKACPQAIKGYWPDQVIHACAQAIRARYSLKD